MTVENLLFFAKQHIHSDHAKILIAELLNCNPLELLNHLEKRIPEEKVDSRKDFMEFISNNGEFRKEEFSHLSDSKSTAIEEIDKIIEQMNASRDENKDDERI